MRRLHALFLATGVALPAQASGSLDNQSSRRALIATHTANDAHVQCFHPGKVRLRVALAPVGDGLSMPVGAVLMFAAR
ncbi:hypothetical protein [Pseudomonas sp. UBA2684]|uniref:hypothetical protein n=1 Tax=Pseudomonas sp. UBA2684 TaxID=1947311 RepID=UPI0025FC4986|nr:hypothetical protein [Pseudomonas sp. UBA2684]|tara:strand:- start:14986 stop:15219 length:234 start_codon:yes stop_codon:yes gene_type:complete